MWIKIKCSYDKEHYACIKLADISVIKEEMDYSYNEEEGVPCVRINMNGGGSFYCYDKTLNEVFQLASTPTNIIKQGGLK